MKRIIGVLLAFSILLSALIFVQAADFGGGGYNFICAEGGRYLNVYAGKDADGTNVCVWERDGSPEQNYTIDAVGGGKYKLHPSSSSSRVIDVNRGNSYNNPLRGGLNVDLWRTNDAPAQEFYITHVGNNLYKIELAALPGYVLQANNPYQNNGNVTLERYTGAANQHWRILKNGSQVTEPCMHNRISVVNEKTVVAQKDSDAHTVTKTYDKVCADCGKTVQSNIRETKTESHALFNNRCSKCGYEAPVVEKLCQHTKQAERKVSSVASKKNADLHTVEEVYDVYCTECGETLQKSQKKTFDEAHLYKDGSACIKCGFTEEVVCNHESTYLSKNATYDAPDIPIKVKDDEYHITYDYADKYCSKCKVLLQAKVLTEEEVPHAYLNGICTGCLHTYYTEKPEPTVLRAEKTEFKPGETIELNWPIANRAKTYDIHIYKEGMSTRYKMIAALTEISASIVLDEEGTYNLCVYSVNNVGFTEGDYLRITVKNPQTERIGYVYNLGDAKNLNLRSGTSTATSLVTKMPGGSAITITGDAINGFYPVRYNGYSGYASAQYITFEKPVEAPSSGIVAQLGKRVANVYGYPAGTSWIGECVWYVRGRAAEKLGVNTGIRGNGREWFAVAQARGIATGWSVKSNSIACFGATPKNSFGHVIFVEEVVGNKVYYTEANVEKPYSDGEISPLDGVLKVKTVSEFTKNAYQGCIYLK